MVKVNKHHLEPCPFCGNAEVVLSMRDNIYTVKCDKCDIEWFLWYTGDRSEKAWNKRRVPVKAE